LYHWVCQKNPERESHQGGDPARWQDSKERIDARPKTDAGKKIYVHRKEMVERSFADAR